MKETKVCTETYSNFGMYSFYILVVLALRLALFNYRLLSQNDTVLLLLFTKMLISLYVYRILDNLFHPYMGHLY